MKTNLLICSLFLLMGVCTSCSGTEKPDRNSLVSLMEEYLNALSKHDPSAVHLAKDVKFVENTEVTPAGKGLWETATGGPTQFKIFVADPVEGQITFMGVIEENNKPVILGARLKIVEGKITEIDHIVIHSNGQPLNPNMSQVRHAFLEVMKIVGVPGITERANNWGPFDLPASHVFKIRNGKIYEIEAIGYVAQHGVKNGWE